MPTVITRCIPLAALLLLTACGQGLRTSSDAPTPPAQPAVGPKAQALATLALGCASAPSPSPSPVTLTGEPNCAVLVDPRKLGALQILLDCENESIYASWQGQSESFPLQKNKVDGKLGLEVPGRDADGDCVVWVQANLSGTARCTPGQARNKALELHTQLAFSPAMQSSKRTCRTQAACPLEGSARLRCP